MLQVKPITPRFGAEISGVDISQPLDAATIRQIGDAFATYAVVIFHDQKLNNDTQAAFGRNFGELEMSPKHIRADNKQRIEDLAISDVSNLDENNKPRDREDRRRLEMLNNRMWHSDASFRAVVGGFSMLYAHAVPPKGGETEFADTRTGYETLDDDMKALIADLKAVHIYGTARIKLGFPGVTEEESKRLPPVEHDIVRYHEGSGRKALYLGMHASHIAGMPTPEGRMLLQDLQEHTSKPNLVYTHSWTVGDLVVWDNRASLHRGRLYDESYPRDLRRVTTKDGTTGAVQQVAAE